MLVKSSLKATFPDVEPRKCQYSYGEQRPRGRVPRDLREGAWTEERQVHLALYLWLL